MFQEIDVDRSGFVSCPVLNHLFNFIANYFFCRKLGILQWQDSFLPPTQLYDYISKHAEKVRLLNIIMCVLVGTPLLIIAPPIQTDRRPRLPSSPE